jgi:anti-sigma regulatory factor (Ser/Thr protein kinase)
MIELSVNGTAEIGAARRRAVEAALSAGLSPERSSDVALVVSELVTNALQHGTGTAPTVRCAVVGDHFELVVSSEASDGGSQSRGPVARPAAPGGRGLYIVATIVDSLTVVGADGRVTVECRFDT